MTRRERMQHRADQRETWAQSAERKSDQRFDTAHNLVKDIPFGQPILVGHHSEKRHRRVLDRCDTNMRKGIELQEKAQHHAAVADTLRDRLETNIFSDDADAIEQLEQRIAENEAKRASMKEINRLYRKSDAAGLAALGIDIEQLRAKLAAAGAYWGSAPHLPYELSNLGGRIKTDRDRIAAIKRDNARHEAAEAAPDGVSIIRSGDYCTVTFAEKPDREVLNALKAAGFFWTRGSWSGRLSNLPDGIDTPAE